MRLNSILIIIFFLFINTVASPSFAQPPKRIGSDKTEDSGKSFEFIKYNILIGERIRKSWVLPESLKGRTDLETKIAIQIARDGRIADIQIKKTSGNLDLDNSALRAVMKANPLPPLPPAVKKDYFEMSIGFTPPGF